MEAQLLKDGLIVSCQNPDATALVRTNMFLLHTSTYELRDRTTYFDINERLSYPQGIEVTLRSEYLADVKLSFYLRHFVGLILLDADVSGPKAAADRIAKAVKKARGKARK